MKEIHAKFYLGQVVYYQRKNRRAVVIDVDPEFSSTDEWYKEMEKNNPPKDKPWYEILLDGEKHTSYVCEMDLLPDTDLKPIRHPLIHEVFDKFENGRYIPIGPC
jgi:heat shock protein HspQ